MLQRQGCRATSVIVRLLFLSVPGRISTQQFYSDVLGIKTDFVHSFTHYYLLLLVEIFTLI